MSANPPSLRLCKEPAECVVEHVLAVDYRLEPRTPVLLYVSNQLNHEAA